MAVRMSNLMLIEYRRSGLVLTPMAADLVNHVRSVSGTILYEDSKARGYSNCTRLTPLYTFAVKKVI